MLDAARLVEVTRSRLEGSAEPLHVYWYRVETEESRAHFCEALCAARADLPLVPIVVRLAVFVDPNMILSDLNGLIADNRNGLEVIRARAGQPIALVLLARGDFRLAQTGSLIVLPEWFPNLGGQEVYVRVRDLLFDVDTVRFNAPEGRTEDLAARLLGLERALVSRLEAVFATTPRRSDAFWGHITKHLEGGTSTEALRAIMTGYKKHIDGIADPRAYRPAAKNKTSLLCQLIALAQRSSVEQLLGLAKVTAEALALPSDLSLRQPFITILLRPTESMDGAVRFAHTVITGAYGGYQFLNAAAHASEHPQVSIAFLYLNSKDLRTVLQDAAGEIERLPAPSV